MNDITLDVQGADELLMMMGSDDVTLEDSAPAAPTVKSDLQSDGTTDAEKIVAFHIGLDSDDNKYKLFVKTKDNLVRKITLDNPYIITFVLDAEDGGGVLQTLALPSGAMPVYSGDTPVSEKRNAGNQVFTGWTPALSAVTGNATYKAAFTPYYTVTFVLADEDGGTTLQTLSLPYGAVPAYTGETPVSEKQSEGTQVFTGWTPSLSAVTGDAVYTAEFTEYYTISFVLANEDGGSTLHTLSLPYGATPAYTGETPVSEKQSEGTQVFAGWTPAISNVTGNAVYTAEFTEYYTITFVRASADGGGTLQTLSLPYGATPAYTGSTPTSEKQNAGTQVFSGWSPAISNVTGNAVYTATFDTYYTITFVLANEDGGTTLQTLSNVAPGTVPAYTGETPTSSRTGYEFTGWSPTIVAANGDATYTAVFEQAEVEEEEETYPNDTIQDSLSVMCAKLANGTADYNVGDFKTIDLGTEGKIRMQVAAKNEDELADGSGYAAYTWVAKDLLNTSHRMNPALSGTTEGTGAVGGWRNSEMRTYINTTILDLVPQKLQAVIKEVKKYSGIYDTSGTAIRDVETIDKLWIPSYREANDDNTFESTGAKYTSVFSSNFDRFRSKAGTSSSIVWWQRSAVSTENFKSVNTNGRTLNNSAQTNNGVLICFCT